MPNRTHSPITSQPKLPRSAEQHLLLVVAAQIELVQGGGAWSVYRTAAPDAVIIGHIDATTRCTLTARVTRDGSALALKPIGFRVRSVANPKVTIGYFVLAPEHQSERLICRALQDTLLSHRTRIDPLVRQCLADPPPTLGS